MGIPEDYRQVVEGAAIGEYAPTAQLAVAGNDRAAFLQGLLTNDVQALLRGVADAAGADAHRHARPRV